MNILERANNAWREAASILRDKSRIGYVEAIEKAKAADTVLAAAIDYKIAQYQRGLIGASELINLINLEVANA